MEQGVVDFHEEGGPSLDFSQEEQDSKNAFTARVNEALDYASGRPFANENLRQATKWLHFRGLAICEATTESEPTLSQQRIVQYLRNKAPHGFHLWMPNGKMVVPKGILLLVAIAHLYTIRIVVFSTRKKPVEIIPDAGKECYTTVTFLSHQDSILSVGEWYPLGLAQDWIKPTATVNISTDHMSTDMLMVSPPAIKRPEGMAPKQKAPVDYKSISDDTLKNLLRVVM